MLFQNREEAGRLLAERLSHLRGREDVLVLALPTIISVAIAAAWLKPRPPQVALLARSYRRVARLLYGSQGAVEQADGLVHIGL